MFRKICFFHFVCICSIIFAVYASAEKNKIAPEQSSEKFITVSYKYPLWISDNEIAFVREKIGWIVRSGAKIVEDREEMAIREEICTLDTKTDKITVIYKAFGKRRKIENLGFYKGKFLVGNCLDGCFYVTKISVVTIASASERKLFKKRLEDSLSLKKRNNKRLFEEGGNIMLQTVSEDRSKILLKASVRTVKKHRKR
ncbi:MAG: hypothetical protein U9Q21_03140 [Candidatus Auribacterota bacterium]|nr:hypothetical protein [Candidatus Auribacterota bacterium]